MFWFAKKWFGLFKWSPLWAVTNYAGIVAMLLFFICGEGVMLRFYGAIWPLTICLLTKPGSEFLFQHYFGLFTKFKIPELVYSLTPLVTILTIWICHLKHKYSRQFFMFSLLSVLITSVMILVDIYLGVIHKISSLTLFLYITTVMVSISGLAWLFVNMWKLNGKRKMHLKEDNKIVDRFKSILINNENENISKFFNLEQYILDGKKELQPLLKNINDCLDLIEINTGNNRQLTTITANKGVISFRTTKLLFDFINQIVTPTLNAFRVTRVLTKIEGHDNMGWDFYIEDLPLMKQVIIKGLLNFHVEKSKKITLACEYK